MGGDGERNKIVRVCEVIAFYIRRAEQGEIFLKIYIYFYIVYF